MDTFKRLNVHTPRGVFNPESHHKFFPKLAVAKDQPSALNARKRGVDKRVRDSDGRFSKDN